MNPIRQGRFGMLTDIFAYRYAAVPIWEAFGEAEQRLLVQAFRIVSEQVCPYYVNGQESARGKAYWTDIHSRLSMELGLKQLSPLAYAYQSVWNGRPHNVSGTYSIHAVCENWMLTAYDDSRSVDRFIKERLSLVELGFRLREEEIEARRADLPAAIARSITSPSRMRLPGNPGAGAIATVERMTAEFQTCVVELNARFMQAGVHLHYHNGFIQRSGDGLLTKKVEEPFWSQVADPLWKNVDTDMKEACDRRDANGRDPAFYALRALESTLKIISDTKAWTTGHEKSAHNFIDNLASKKVGFLADWEASAIKNLFTHVRNPLGHGPGTQEMPSLGSDQTDCVILGCMVWIRTLVVRHAGGS